MKEKRDVSASPRVLAAYGILKSWNNKKYARPSNGKEVTDAFHIKKRENGIVSR